MRNVERLREKFAYFLKVLLASRVDYYASISMEGVVAYNSHGFIQYTTHCKPY